MTKLHVFICLSYFTYRSDISLTAEEVTLQPLGWPTITFFEALNTLPISFAFCPHEDSRSHLCFCFILFCLVLFYRVFLLFVSECPTAIYIRSPPCCLRKSIFGNKLNTAKDFSSSVFITVLFLRVENWTYQCPPRREWLCNWRQVTQRKLVQSFKKKQQQNTQNMSSFLSSSDGNGEKRKGLWWKFQCFFLVQMRKCWAETDDPTAGPFLGPRS